MSEKEERVNKLEELKSLGINPYPIQYKPTDLAADIKKRFEDSQESFLVNVAGRIILKRVFGKALFLTLEDESGEIQIYAQEQKLPDTYPILKKLIDLGDIIGVKGSLFRTQKNEITILTSEFTLLSKSIQPFPDKFHGITDVEIRYRQRYADMIVNRKVRKDFILRAQVIRTIRDTLHQLDFMEVETPILQSIPGGANARPFITHHHASGMDVYLRIATELHLKRIITGGLPRVFELGRIFRNEGVSYKHNPEFTSLELYEAYGDNESMMRITEKILCAVFLATHQTLKITYQGKEIDFTPPFKRMTMLESIFGVTGIAITQETTYETLRAAAISKGIEEDKIEPTLYSLITQIFEEFVEETLLGPVFITDHPHETSPLAKQNMDNPAFTDRFELFIAGNELANAFSEQNNPFIQKEQFMKQVKEKDMPDSEELFYDEDYINALEYGMPPTGGLGIGIDRLCMLVMNTHTIRDTLIFPHMKPDKSRKISTEEV